MPNPEFFHLNEPESERKARQEKEKQETRRSFLKKLGLGLGGLGATVGGLEVARRIAEEDVEKGQEEEPEVFPESVEVRKDERIYKNGETLEAKISRIKVDGWKLNFPEVDMARTAWMQLDPVTGRYGGYSLLVRDSKGELIGWVSRFASDVADDFSPNNAKRKNGLYDVQSLYLLPDFDNPEIRISLREYAAKGASLFDYLKNFRSGQSLPKKKDFPVKVYEYTILLDAHFYPSENQKDKKRVCSEIPLPHEQMAKVHRLHQIFSDFGNPGQVYIQREGRIFGGEETDTFDHHDPLYDRVILSSKNFTDPKFIDGVEHTACHELMHGLVRNSKLSGEQFRAWKRLEGHYKYILEAAGDWPAREFSPFTVFREAGYEKSLNVDERVKSEAGHPWDNPNELVASTVTILRYFPEEFSVNYRRLSPAEQKLVKQTVQYSLKFLQAMNQRQEALKKLLPNLEKIRSALGL